MIYRVRKYVLKLCRDSAGTRAAILVAAILVVVLGAIAWVRAASARPPGGQATARSLDLPLPTTPIMADSDYIPRTSPSLTQPPTRTASHARLADGEAVIGIVVVGRARAYRLRALGGQQSHIVNDLVDGVPVSVTYCDLAHCVRGFAGKRSRKPLDISLKGLKNGRMIISAQGAAFFQDSGQPLDPSADTAPFPYAAYATTQTSWKEWKSAHPDTDVYEGFGASPAAQ